MAAGVCGLLAVSARAGGPTTIVLNGTARDFASSPSQAAANHVSYDNDFENAEADDKGIVALPSELNPNGTPIYNTIALGADGTPVYLGGNGTATTFAYGNATAEQQFYAWYHNDPTYNVDIPISITLTNNGSGLYTFNDPNFFPLDGLGFGDYADGHNYSFTDEFDTDFTYTGIGSETFSFSGDDDVYVYINNYLVIDLGGVHGTETQSVNLDDLGLTAGDAYSLDIFSAERHTTGSDLALQTELVLSSAAVPDSCDTGLLLAATATLLLLRSWLGKRTLVASESAA
jgi:fibro-slime domain-containing protein